MKKVMKLAVWMLTVPALVLPAQSATSVFDSLKGRVDTMLAQVKYLEKRVTDIGFEEMKKVLPGLRRLLLQVRASVLEAKELQAIAAVQGSHYMTDMFIQRNQELVNDIEQRMKETMDQINQFAKQRGLQ